jgi:hypothetical protein
MQEELFPEVLRYLRAVPLQVKQLLLEVEQLAQEYKQEAQ